MGSEVAGKLCTLSIEGSEIGYSDEFSITMNQGTIDVTHRDSDWWSKFKAGLRDWEISGGMLYIFDDLGKKKLQYHYTARSPSTLTVILTLADGSVTLSGEAVLTTISYANPPYDKATASFSLKGDGALTASAS